MATYYLHDLADTSDVASSEGWAGQPVLQFPGKLSDKITHKIFSSSTF